MKTFVMGDIHGSLLALKQCLQRSKFNYQKDKLIVLGDIIDGHDDAFECVEELLKIRHLVAIRVITMTDHQLKSNGTYTGGEYL